MSHHTKESLKNFSNDKQLFFDEPRGKIIKAYDLDSYEDVSQVYPILRTAIEVGGDIPFEKGHTNPVVARSLWAVCAGAFPSKTSITGFQTFDGLPCKTPTQVQIHLKRMHEELSNQAIPKLITVYDALMKVIPKLDPQLFETDEDYKNLALACQAFEGVAQ